jgi:hypothetical protein
VDRPTEDLTADSTDPLERSLTDDLRRLAEDGKTFAEAEYAYQRARLGYAGSMARGIALSLLAAACLLFLAVMALLFGLILALSPLVTAWGATAIVAGGLGLLAVLAGLAALVKWRSLSAALSDDERAA